MAKTTTVTRGFVATVTYDNGVKLTTTVYGANAYAAEVAALAERKGAVRVVVHSELR